MSLNEQVFGFDQKQQQALLTTIFNKIEEINTELDLQGKSTERIVVNYKNLTEEQKNVISKLKDQYGLMQKLDKLGDDQIEKQKVMNEFAETAAKILEQREKNVSKYLTNMEKAERDQRTAANEYQNAMDQRLQVLDKLRDKETMIYENSKDRAQTEERINSLQEQSLQNGAKMNRLDSEKQKNLEDQKKIQNEIFNLQQQLDSGNVSDDQRQEVQSQLNVLMQQQNEIQQQSAMIVYELNATDQERIRINNELSDAAAQQRDFYEESIRLENERLELEEEAIETELRQEAARKAEIEARQKLRREENEQDIRDSHNRLNAEKLIRAERLKEENKELKKKGAANLTPEEKRQIQKNKKEAIELEKQVEEDERGGDREGFVAMGKNGGGPMINYGQDVNGHQITTLGDYMKNTLVQSISKAISAMAKQLDETVKNVAGLYTTYNARVNYRLNQLGKFEEEVKLVNDTVGYSGAVTQQKVIEKIGEAVDKGIAYNVEQRAFLSTVSENIQSTFDAFNSNLTRIIRIQQQDSTVARLGLEKSLNDLLNFYYQDTSYLNDAFDNVSSAIFEMQAMQSRNEAVETEFVIQKWLGSLYSLGASSNAVQQIATGLGYLGSGNVNALAGNTQLQSLLALSASKAGLDYAELLTGGLTARDTNELLKAMVGYLSDIADSTAQNKVVTSAFGNVFGMSISDIKSFQNLSSSIGDIYQETLDYKQATAYTQNALNNYTRNLGTAAYMNNIVENIKFGVGSQFANGGMYVFYRVVDLLDELTGGGPTISIAPWGLGIQATVFELIKSAMFGTGLLTSLAFGNYTGNPTDLSTWGYNDIVQRGSGFGLRSTQQGTSYSASVGNASSSDTENQAISEGSEKTTQVESTTGRGQEKGIDDIYEALVYPGDKNKLSDLSAKVVDIDEKLKRALELGNQITTQSVRKAVNVNIQKINGFDIQGGVIRTQPDEDWVKLIKGAAVLIKYGEVMEGFNDKLIQQIVKNASDDDKLTLQDFLDIMVPMLESDTGIPVRIESTDSVTNLMADLTRR